MSNNIILSIEKLLLVLVAWVTKFSNYYTKTDNQTQHNRMLNSTPIGERGKDRMTKLTTPFIYLKICYTKGRRRNAISRGLRRLMDFLVNVSFTRKIGTVQCS